MGYNGDGLRMSMTCCLFKDCYSKRVSDHSLIWQRLKGRQRMGEVYSEKKGRLQLFPDWTLLAWRSWRQVK